MIKKVNKKANKKIVKKIVKKKTTKAPVKSIENSNITDIKWVDIKSIKLWKDNPRINDEAVPEVAKSIDKHGFKSPLVVWDKDNVIYKGNTTFKAAKELGLKKVPVCFVSFPSIVAAKAYGISDNKSSEFSEWDNEILSDLMSAKGMRTQEHTGFKEKEIAHLLMEPNLAKLHSIGESSEGILKTIKIICKPEDSESVLTYLNKTVAKKFRDRVVIK